MTATTEVNVELSTTAIVSIYTVGAGLGAWLGGRLFGCKLNPGIAVAIAFIASLAYLTPTVGAPFAFAVMVVGIRQFSEGGDWLEAVYSTVVANGCALILALLWNFTSG